ncbi:MAG: hypothetical protein EXS31_13145 [Pedosphaera sp.]|nr:hypothetical protein [Pedosphaera sp.]
MSTATTRRRLPLGWLIIGGILLLVVVRLIQSGSSRNEIETIRKSGYPTTLAELHEWYQDVPAEENAALKILEAANSKIDASDKALNLPGIGKTPWPEPGTKLAEEELEALAQHIHDNTGALKFLHEASSLSRSRYPMDLTRGPNTLLPHLAQIKGLAILLRHDVLLQSDAGQTEAAMKSLRAAFTLSGSLVPEPLLISDLVRIACVAITLEGMQHPVTDLKLSDDQLQQLSQWISKTEQQGPQAYIRGMAGERCMGIEWFRNPGMMLSANAGQGSATGPAVAGSAAFALLRVTGILDRDRKMLVRCLSSSIEAANLPFPENLRRIESQQAQRQRQLGSLSGKLMIMTRMLLPALDKAFHKEARLISQLRAARTALAVERYRLAHDGKLPDTIQALVPAFLDQVPTDAFDGNPLELELLPQGFRIVSQGATEAANLQGPPKKNGSRKIVGFTVAR